MKRQQAMTLIEMVVVLAIVSLIVYAGSTLLYSSYQHSQRHIHREIAEEELRYAMNRIATDIRHAEDVQAPIGYQNNAHQQRAFTVVHKHPSSALLKSFRTWYVGENLQTDSINAWKIKDDYHLFSSTDRHAKGGQPVARYMNAQHGYSGQVPGLMAYFYDMNGEACNLADDVYFIEIILTHTDEHNKMTQIREYIPIEAKLGGGEH